MKRSIGKCDDDENHRLTDGTTRKEIYAVVPRANATNRTDDNARLHVSLVRRSVMSRKSVFTFKSRRHPVTRKASTPGFRDSREKFWRLPRGLENGTGTRTGAAITYTRRSPGRRQSRLRCRRRRRLARRLGAETDGGTGREKPYANNAR